MATTMIHVRIDENIKEQAAEALAAMGLSVSDAVRVLLTRVAAEKALPFALKVPNAETRAAIEEIESGKALSFPSVDALMEYLNADD
jgi:DNA-damage-inducible protein J